MRDKRDFDRWRDPDLWAMIAGLALAFTAGILLGLVMALVCRPV